eukprot:NODE_2987_length_999_cov_2.688421_g2498_i0.p2 GENE.NODE_2987_length_999_cov_2.688421_g2498_i0~~NODE_2987_length_999_cov_2.688421_g2498_i0.p2  ORF type:complete len:240 (-),score=22.33 NODE_2987_length_999_cov_2.688421_g2498_i0:278-961(-)
MHARNQERSQLKHPADAAKVPKGQGDYVFFIAFNLTGRHHLWAQVKPSKYRAWRDEGLGAEGEALLMAPPCRLPARGVASAEGILIHDQGMTTSPIKWEANDELLAKLPSGRFAGGDPKSYQLRRLDRVMFTALEIYQGYTKMVAVQRCPNRMCGRRPVVNGVCPICPRSATAGPPSSDQKMQDLSLSFVSQVGEELTLKIPFLGGPAPRSQQLLSAARPHCGTHPR